jgi:pimeloyl-ACP methyl ester carboxylesterase
VDTLTLVEPGAYWILEQLGEQTEALDELNGFLHELFGREVTEEHLARFLEYAGLVNTRAEARSHPNWERWVPHRMALSWQDEALDHPDRSLDDLERVSWPTLLVKGTITADWLRRVVDVLCERLPNATVEELQGSHACHIESIDQFLDILDRHLSRADTGR